MLMYVFKPWIRFVLSECRVYFDKIKQKFPDIAPDQNQFVFDQEAKNSLSFLQKHLIIAPVDKAGSNFAFVCKSLYANILAKELRNPQGAYKRQDKTVQDISCIQKAFLEEHKLWSEKMTDKLPYLYFSCKLHKIPFSFRFICACGVVTTTKLSKLLSDVLLFVMHELRQKDDEHIARTGIRRFFIVDGYEVALFQSRWSSLPVSHLFTGDFSNMYTSIPLDDLKSKLRYVLKEAWVWKASHFNISEQNIHKLVLRWNSRSVEWIDRSKRRASVAESEDVDTSTVFTFSLDKLVQFLNFLIDNVFVVNDGVVFQQIRGIPMGTNCGPVLANLYLYAYESVFIDQLISEGRSETAEMFHRTFRFIDDTLSFNNQYWPIFVSKSSEAGGIYPSALTYNDTSICDTKVHFLGMQFEVDLENRKCTIDIFDKRKEFSFYVQRYPDLRSFIPSYIPYGVFLGLLHRTYRICSVPSFFQKRVMEMLEVFVSKGCSSNRLLKTLHDFLRSRCPLRWNTKWGKLFAKIKTSFLLKIVV
jgi:hypothetical protein